MKFFTFLIVFQNDLAQLTEEKNFFLGSWVCLNIILDPLSIIGLFRTLIMILRTIVHHSTNTTPPPPVLASGAPCLMVLAPRSSAKLQKESALWESSQWLCGCCWWSLSAGRRHVCSIFAEGPAPSSNPSLPSTTWPQKLHKCCFILCINQRI